MTVWSQQKHGAVCDAPNCHWRAKGATLEEVTEEHERHMELHAFRRDQVVWYLGVSWKILYLYFDQDRAVLEKEPREKKMCNACPNGDSHWHGEWRATQAPISQLEDR